MSDVQPSHCVASPSTPPCPLCGGETFLTQMHKAVAKETDVFRCRQCGVEYPLARKTGSG